MFSIKDLRTIQVALNNPHLLIPANDVEYAIALKAKVTVSLQQLEQQAQDESDKEEGAAEDGERHPNDTTE